MSYYVVLCHEVWEISHFKFKFKHNVGDDVESTHRHAHRLAVSLVCRACGCIITMLSMQPSAERCHCHLRLPVSHHLLPQLHCRSTGNRSEMPENDVRTRSHVV
jgi:hypothetical protein